MDYKLPLLSLVMFKIDGIDFDIKKLFYQYYTVILIYYNSHDILFSLSFI